MKVRYIMLNLLSVNNFKIYFSKFYSIFGISYIIFLSSIILVKLLPKGFQDFIQVYISMYVIAGNVYFGYKISPYLQHFSKKKVINVCTIVGILILFFPSSRFPAFIYFILDSIQLSIGLGFFFTIAVITKIGISRVNKFQSFITNTFQKLQLLNKIDNINFKKYKSIFPIIRIIFGSGMVLYFFFTLAISADYLRTQYGLSSKILCSFGSRDIVQNKIVRVVGGFSEGTGFFISPNQVMTNFHVIADEPSPKIIFSNGKFITPIKIIGDKDKDLAILITSDEYSDYIFPLPNEITLRRDEPLIAAGFPMGTNLNGSATLLKGRFIDYRTSRRSPVAYLQTDISLAEGMSGGPLVDQCGNVIGVNTMGLAGLSLFINGNFARESISTLTDQNISKINVDFISSPENAVATFYSYLKARRMEEGFRLLSKEYLNKTDFTEWTSRFSDVLDVEVVLTQKVEDTTDMVLVKFTTKNWNDDEVNYHYYEGTWQTTLEDGVYKMLKSNILEVEEPNWEWFYN